MGSRLRPDVAAVLGLAEGDEILGSQSYAGMIDRFRERLAGIDGLVYLRGTQNRAGEIALTLGYKTFQAGKFTFKRDEYFAHIFYPGGRHVMPVDEFLRALPQGVQSGDGIRWEIRQRLPSQSFVERRFEAPFFLQRQRAIVTQRIRMTQPINVSYRGPTSAIRPRS